MPVISMFYGLIIRMYSEKGERHSIPHIHVLYQGNECVYGFDGALINGEGLPKAKQKLLDAWLEIHQDELYMNWDLLSAGDEFVKIEPLR